MDYLVLRGVIYSANSIMQISNILIKVICFALKAAIKQGIIHVGVGLVLFHTSVIQYRVMHWPLNLRGLSGIVVWITQNINRIPFALEPLRMQLSTTIPMHRFMRWVVGNRTHS